MRKRKPRSQTADTSLVSDTSSVEPVGLMAMQFEVYGILVSRLDHPVTVKYGAEEIRLSPRGQTNILAKSLLGPLPAGVLFVQR